MPLTLPNLDDRRYADLVKEARALIPTHAPEWTNHNPSDPGITLIELFAWLTEMQIYRLNRVTDDNIRTFLRLLNGEDWQPSGTTSAALADDIRTSVLALRRRERAISGEDFEALALEADAGVARVRCLPRRNALMDFETEQPGHISLIVVPWQESALTEVIDAVKTYLEPRRLLTTFLHLIGPQYVSVDIQATVAPLADVEETDLRPQVITALRDFLDPLHGGEDGDGWPFGRNVFVSELYQLLDQLSGVDYVTGVTVSSDDPARLIRNERLELIGLTVKPHELVSARTLTVTAPPV
jgi:hypothetical protein